MSVEPYDADPVHDATVRAGFESALSVVQAAEAAGVSTLDWFEHATEHCRHNGVSRDAVHIAVENGIVEGLNDTDVRGSAPEVSGAALATLHELLTTTVDRIYRG
ncbi:hypothetical protein BJY24_006442 [Nocardia transvalensis]|uniref:Uncharacterized protein n=1 Tax=Nocardia transvalensis TaxID=37333 RepID=A0A7W9PKG0_9NOCA|nr:hypothetical protein [Nocardia transvalensis]MBB5917530.1 hypothetical protein [Nocardia transvalensis]